nr:zinc finger, CCHC-type [Tanacetum cinerariifolium]
MAAAMKHMALNFAKMEKFEGVDFRRWQKKMHFLLFSMSVVYVLTTLMPEDGGENPTVEQVRRRTKWENDDYVCIGLILNGMSDSLGCLNHLRIEESLRVHDSNKPKGNDVDGPPVVNMVEHNNSSRETVHVCKDRCWFKTCESLNDRSILHMRNESTALVHGSGCVDL